MTPFPPPRRSFLFAAAGIQTMPVLPGGDAGGGAGEMPDTVMDAERIIS